MNMLDATGRDYWRGVLAGGGATVIPRWAPEPVPGTAQLDTPLPAELLTAAARSTAPLGSMLLAAHAAVLAALSGEAAVSCGYLAGPEGRSLPCRLSVDAGSWWELVRQANLAEVDIAAYQDFPVHQLRAEPGLAGPVWETEFDPSGSGAELAAGTVLRVGIVNADGRTVLRLRYRTEVLDAAAAGRVAGYHLAALGLVLSAPDTDPRVGCLLSAQEIAFQIDGLAGPARELPDRRFHELFQDRVALHPERVAAEHGGQAWTYRELNTRANRIAHALIAAGLPPEGVVAVATERNLNWMAAVIAIFKAGGAYLPIEPHLPADRIATTLRRAECAIVLTEPASTTTLDPALHTVAGVTRLLFDTIYTQPHPNGDPDIDLGLPIGADRLAYIYFTSGSTGEPKGAMCEHAGMLNHLYAKIADLGIGEGAVIAQTAPQSFDISLWQLISALLVGGRTHLIAQDTILDVARFVDTLADARIQVAQLVPSYLEVVLTYLAENPRPLPELACVSVTGEALKLELTQRWFTQLPHIPLVNAYGLTETSDDTNHERLHAAPTDNRPVPLGPPVHNVHLYVVDPQLNPVPLGAPGLIVFSGICVGRGYINDPDRTAAAYRPDPHRPRQRLYLAGDYGRWRPDGKLEFLGRRDNQVKISGFRIEIGEIDNTLLRVPDIRDAATVVAERAGQAKHLTAFYTSPHPLPTTQLREHLGAALPHYMVPTSYHRLDTLPLTGNGKIDTKALTALAEQLDTPDPAGQDLPEPPTTPTEARLAGVWARVLGVATDQIGRHDHFFDRGGTSLLAVKVAIGLNREVSLKDLTRHPVLSELATHIDTHNQPTHQPTQPTQQPAQQPAQQPTALLQPLTPHNPTAATALICFPHAGGNAINYQPLATALRASPTAVYAVELPGHDPATPEPLAPIDQIADRVTEEISTELTRRGLSSVQLWGHSAGTALAHATAHRLTHRGISVSRVFLAAQLPGDSGARRAAAADLATRAIGEITARLRGPQGHPELAELDPQHADHVTAAYRHDVITAHHYFADLLDNPDAQRLDTPVTVVVAADDPSTAAGDPLREWRRLAEHVEVHQMADGGHHFLRTRPEQAAQLVVRATDLLAS